MSKFTPAQEAEIVAWYHGQSTAELRQHLIDKYGVTMPLDCVKQWRLRRRLLSAHPYSGMFRKGNDPVNREPIGTEKVNFEGYTIVKIADKPYAHDENWVTKHRLIWERAHGPVPDGYQIFFVNGDRSDVRLENLCCAPIREGHLMMRYGLLTSDPELYKSALLVAKIYAVIKDSTKKK